LKHVFELKPLLVAALIGAGLSALLFSDEGNIVSFAAAGLVIGAGVQIGVRAFGVS